MSALFAFTAHAGAQPNILNRLNRPPNAGAKTGNTNRAEIANAARGYTYSVVYSFCSEGGAGCTDGSVPAAGLIKGTAGKLYGTTFQGGANGGGTVFELNNAGQETVLYSFCSEGGANCTDGADPEAGLAWDAAGNLYGTTVIGGKPKHHNCSPDCGTVFKLDNTGTETVLYSFCSEGGENCTDGYLSDAGLIRDAAGNLYGTTKNGGGYSGGVVFRLAPAGVSVSPTSLNYGNVELGGRAK